MRTFLGKDKRPWIKWSLIPENTYYQGEVPEGYDLCTSPSKGYIIVDIDRHGDKNGFDHIPQELWPELQNTLNYFTKNKGLHCWFKYTGNKNLKNTISKFGIDLRVGLKGYVVWYHTKYKDIRECIHLINETSKELNEWIEKLFA